MSPIRVFAVALRAGLTLDAAREASEVMNSPNRESVDDVVRFCRETGSPRVGALIALADALDDAQQRARDIEVGMASANATMRVMLALPVVTLLSSEFFGFGAVGFLVTTAVGWVCLAIGAALMLLAWRWMRAIRATIPNPAAETGLALDLAGALSGVGALSRANRAALEALMVGWGTATETENLDRAVSMSRTHGVPVSHLLAMEAERTRSDARHAVRYALELLPTALLAPVGACLLPAFIVTTVVPVVVSMARGFFVN